MPWEFRVLGPLEVRHDGRLVHIGPPKLRSVLTLLLAEAGHTVAVESFVDELWGERPPPSAVANVRTYIARLRQLIAPDRVLADHGRYGLAVGPEELDLPLFLRHAARGRAALAAADAATAVVELATAAGYWHGRPFDTVPLGELLQARRTALDDEYVAAVEAFYEARLRLGEHRSVVPLLRRHVVEYPLRERGHELLMIALYRSGDPAAALTAYGSARTLLHDELGIEPGTGLRAAQTAILLRQDPAAWPGDPAGRSEAASPAGPATASIFVGDRTVGVPAQLPPDLTRFAGRADALAGLDQAVDADTGARIAVVMGPPGVGKTALAVHWSHRVRRDFPDGQLYVNLRGFDPHEPPVTPDQALRDVLEALGVPPRRIPTDTTARSALYRSLLDERRALVLLDNARDAGQVRPLLPGTSACVTVVTSRNQLTSLIAGEGAHPVPLSVMSLAEGRQLLADRIGAGRVSAEPSTVEHIIAGCGGLPLALALVAAWAVTHPDFALAVLAKELVERDGLGALAGGDPASDVRAAFASSYRALRAGPARLFRLLAVHPGSDVGVPAAASLAGVPPAGARSLLAELAAAHLVGEQTPGRYAMHDLVRLYAGEVCDQAEPEASRRAARQRLLDHYLHTAHRAVLAVHAGAELPSPAPARPSVVVEDVTEAGRALRWLAVERPVLVALVRQAADAGLLLAACHLAAIVGVFLQRQGHWHDWVSTHRVALDAAGRLGDRSVEALLHRRLAGAYVHLDRYDDAGVHLHRAVELYDELADTAGQALTHVNLGFVFDRQGRYGEALRHAERAHELFLLAGDLGGRATALAGVGWCHTRLGEHRQAVRCCHEAASLLRELGNRAGEAAALLGLGHARQHLGDHADAVAQYRRALELFRAIGDRTGEARALGHLADAWELAGHREPARAARRQALAILTELGHPDSHDLRAKLVAAERLR